MKHQKTLALSTITLIFVLLSSLTVLAMETGGLFDSLNGGDYDMGGGLVVSQDGVTVTITGAPNEVVAFDSNEHPADCNDSSCDNDLRQDQGIVMIVREWGYPVGTQNDNGSGGILTFVFSEPVELASFQVLDNEEGASWSVNGGAPVAIPSAGNGSLTTVPVNASDVILLVVTFNGSGAVDDLEFDVNRNGGEGCTPGFWKITGGKAAAIQALWLEAGVNPDALYSDTFGVGPAIALRDAIEANGGGENALIRHSVAAYLNASSTVNYFYSTADIIAMVQDAFNSGDFETPKNVFDYQNNMGCPLSASSRNTDSSSNLVPLPPAPTGFRG